MNLAIAVLNLIQKLLPNIPENRNLADLLAAIISLLDTKSKEIVSLLDTKSKEIYWTISNQRR